jgi:hypothetical protein
MSDFTVWLKFRFNLRQEEIKGKQTLQSASKYDNVLPIKENTERRFTFLNCPPIELKFQNAWECKIRLFLANV